MAKQIHPYTIYNLEEAADILGVDRKTMYVKVRSGEIDSKMVGKGHKFLGENLLRFMGPPTISRMKPDMISIPVQVTEPERETIAIKTKIEKVKLQGYYKV